MSRPVYYVGWFMALVLGGALLAHAQQHNNDYFSPERDDKLLKMVEGYHLTGTTFWPKYRDGILRGNFQRAIGELNFVLRYYPNHPKALMLLANIAKMKKAPHIAEPYFKKALHLYPQHALTHAQYGRFLVEVGKVTEGIEHLDRAVQLDPQLMVAYDWLAQAYRKQGRYEEARRVEQRKDRAGEP